MFYVKILTFAIVLNTKIFCICAKEMELYSESLHRSKRQQLLYPNSTLLQLNAGFGVPSPVANINFNYLIQANFQLPWNTTQIPENILYSNSGYTGNSKKKREVDFKNDDSKYQNDVKLYDFYKHIENMLDGFGYNGKSCVLQTLCQLGAEPLHTDDEEDLLHEMANFVLNPTNDAVYVAEKHDTYTYIKAYTNGQNRRDCAKLYHGCSISLIDSFTRLHDKI